MPAISRVTHALPAANLFTIGSRRTLLTQLTHVSHIPPVALIGRVASAVIASVILDVKLATITAVPKVFRFLFSLK